ncbi:uncharacterized protein G2W53_041709 [Senna tora]|uniref:Uncharacterized protein n=1 Tax=Senna tora TaxID=362788 RepID=A0A834SF79_9FABA|nr:uncharacterized protein G2W53_041709 [Senna tora]
MLQLESSWHGRIVNHVLTYSERQTAVESQKPSRISRQKTCCSSWHGSCVDHVLKYSRRQIAVGSQKPSRITRQKTYCANESNTSVRVVFANRSAFDAPIGVILAWEERGSCPNIFQMTNRGRILETFKNYKAKDLLRKSQKPSRITRQKTCCASESNMSVRVPFANRSGFDAPIGVVLAWEKRGSCLNIFRTTNWGRILENFTNYEAKELLSNETNTSIRVVFANQSGFDAPIRSEERGSCLNIFRTTNRGRILETFTNYEAKDLLRNESNTSVRVVFANRSGFDAPVRVVLAWEEHGSCLNIFRTTNHGQISETFTNYEAKDLLRNESNTSVRIVFANRSGFDAPIGLEERGSCLKIFWTINRGWISETFTNYETKDLLRNRNGMGGAWIMYYHIPDDKSRSDLRNLHELRGKRLVALVRQTRRFALYLRIRVVLMLQLDGRSVDHVLTYSGRKIAVGS